MGGVRAADVDQLLSEVQGFGWTELAGEVAPLEARLKEARAWCTKVTRRACLPCVDNIDIREIATECHVLYAYVVKHGQIPSSTAHRSTPLPRVAPTCTSWQP